MSFVDVDKLKVTERLPGWRGRYFNGVNMTVAHYEFTRGASIHEHYHPQEELYEVLEGELELTVNGVTGSLALAWPRSCRATRGTRSGR